MITRTIALVALTASLSLLSPPPAYAAPKCQQIEGRADGFCNPGLASTNPELLTDGPRYLHTICEPSDGDSDTLTWTQRQRPSTASVNLRKTAQMQDYGLTGNPRDYVLDHIVNISIGGHPADPRNTYPQLKSGPNGSLAKDKLESQLWRDVCAQRLTLQQAQDRIIREWVRYPAKG